MHVSGCLGARTLLGLKSHTHDLCTTPYKVSSSSSDVSASKLLHNKDALDLIGIGAVLVYILAYLYGPEKISTITKSIGIFITNELLFEDEHFIFPGKIGRLLVIKSCLVISENLNEL